MKLIRSFHILLVLAIYMEQNYATRKIANGRETQGDRKYMAYFIRANPNYDQYNAWTCGGAIITKLHILTSAGCLSSFDLIYAIVGYNRYVNDEIVDLDTCTMHKKKKVVKTLIPNQYKMGEGTPNEWANAYDIGIAVLENEIDFKDESYLIKCSYIPEPIAVNFGLSAQAVGKDVVALGWGSGDGLRMPFHQMDRNQEFLHEADTQIVDIEVCKEKFNTTLMALQKQKEYVKFICTDGNGTLDSNGNVLDYGELVMGCEDNMEATMATSSTKKRLLRDKSKNLSFIDELYDGYIDDLYDDNQYGGRKVGEISSKDNDTAESTQHSTKNGEREKIDFSHFFEMADSYDFSRKSVREFGRHVMQDVNERFVTYDVHIRTKMCRRIMREINMKTMYRRMWPSTCQNDHGGPLISWIGGAEVVIGITVTNLLNDEYECITPNLYVATAYHPLFITCSVEATMQDGPNCNSEDDGIIEKCIDWNDFKNKNMK